MLFSSSRASTRSIQSVNDQGAQEGGLVLADSAFEAAIGALPESGGIVTAEPGSYLLDQVDLSALGRTGVKLIMPGVTLIKASTTVGHMFVDLAGVCSDLLMQGMAFDLKRASFSAGQTVSAYHAVRAQRLRFLDINVYDGIEEGLKLYNCRDVIVERSRFANVRNNGVQFQTLDDSSIYTGSGSYITGRDLRVVSSEFDTIDDGLKGTADGQGVYAGSTYAGNPTRNVLVHGCIFKDCVRAAWSENNAAGTPAQNVVFSGNAVFGGGWHGFGFIGVYGGVISGNVIREIGTEAPGSGTSSEVFGIKVGGSADPKSNNVVVSGNVIVDGRGGSALMLHGIKLAQANHMTVADNEILGAVTAEIDEDSGTLSNYTVVAR